jgi:hypothetical protein
MGTALIMNKTFFQLITSPEQLATKFRFLKEPTRSIKLDQIDWCWATWRDHQPWPRPQPRAFDIERARAKKEDYLVNWYTASLDLSISTEEALFWFAEMMSKTPGDSSLYSRLRDTLKANVTANKLSLQQLKDIVTQSRYDRERAHALIPMQVLSSLLTVDDLVDWLVDSPTILTAFIEFRKRVLPYLSVHERSAIKDRLRLKLSAQSWTSEKNMSFYIASSLGMHEEIQTLVESWPDDYGEKAWNVRTRVLQYIVLGLGSASAVEKHWRRLKLKLDDPLYIRGFVAHTEHGSIDLIATNIEANIYEERLIDLIRAFAVVDVPEVSPFMFELATQYKKAWRKDAPVERVAPAIQWLNDHKLNAILGLLPFVTSTEKLADDILAFLRQMQRDGDEQFIQEAIGYYSAADRVVTEVLNQQESLPPEFDDTNTPDWLNHSLLELQNLAVKHNQPQWLVVEELPPLPIGGFRLNKKQLIALLTSLPMVTDTAAPQLVQELKTRCDPNFLDKFAQQMLDAWIKDYAPNKDRWVLLAAGHLGHSGVALKLVPLIKTWRSAGNQPHALAGLVSLRLIGTDAALMQLNAIANDQQLKALRLKALEHMEAIAAALNLSRDRLEDRIIPTCGLDRPGEIVFELGSRKLILTISPDLEPALRNEKGQLEVGFPKAKASDDQQLYRQSSERWKLLKRELKATMQLQAVRLEQALVNQRRWFKDEFLNLLVPQPIFGRLARRLLWSGFDSSGQMLGLFRVTIDGQFLNQEHSPVDLDHFGEIGLAHPLQLTDSTLSAWRAIFHQMEIHQPFPQLDRAIHKLTEMESEHDEIHKARGYIIPGLSIPSTLEKRGWIRGAIESGCFSEHIKPFESAGVTAICCYQSVPIYYDRDAEDQTLEHCYFVHGKAQPESGRTFDGGIVLEEVDPIVLSEVMGDLFELIKKAKSQAYE